MYTVRSLCQVTKFTHLSYHSSVHVWKVARYTCGSPLSIAECDGYTDAGAVCSNLSSFAMTRIQDFCKQNGLSPQGGCFVSVGAGYFAPEELGGVDVRDELHFRTRLLNPAESKQRMKNVVTFYTSAAVSRNSFLLSSWNDSEQILLSIKAQLCTLSEMFRLQSPSVAVHKHL